MVADTPSWAHIYIPAPARAPGAVPPRTLLLLHGTGGDEHDLVPAGHALDPRAALLSPRGPVLEHGMPRFFRRLAEGVFDEDDLVLRTHELATFVAQAAARYDFDLRRVVAAGYSNGANIAVSLLLLHPGLLTGAALFHAMVPLEPSPLPSLAAVPVLLSAGRHDPIASPGNTERLAALLRAAGAHVTLAWQPDGHMLGVEEVAVARAWLERQPRVSSPVARE